MALLLATFKQYLTINIAPRWPYEITTISTSNNGKMNFEIWYRGHTIDLIIVIAVWLYFVILFIYLFHLFDRYWWVWSTCSSVTDTLFRSLFWNCFNYLIVTLFFFFDISSLLPDVICFITTIYFLVVCSSWSRNIYLILDTWFVCSI